MVKITIPKAAIDEIYSGKLPKTNVTIRINKGDYEGFEYSGKGGKLIIIVED